MKIAWLAIAAMACEVTVGFLLAALTPNHDLLRDYVSTVGVEGQPYALHFPLIGATGAALHLLAIWLAWPRLHGKFQQISGGCFAAFFAFIGIGLAFRCDPGCALASTEAIIHQTMGTIAFVFLGLAAIFAAIAWPQRGIIAMSCVVVAADIWLLVADVTDMLRGAAERTTILAMFVWSLVLWRTGVGNGASKHSPERIS